MNPKVGDLIDYFFYKNAEGVALIWNKAIVIDVRGDQVVFVKSENDTSSLKGCTVYSGLISDENLNSKYIGREYHFHPIKRIRKIYSMKQSIRTYCERCIITRLRSR